MAVEEPAQRRARALGLQGLRERPSCPELRSELEDQPGQQHPAAGGAAAGIHGGGRLEHHQQGGLSDRGEYAPLGRRKDQWWLRAFSRSPRDGHGDRDDLLID